jgi:hypothetical protein
MPIPREDHQQQSTSRVNVPLQQAIEALLTDRPIAYHPILAHIVGSAIAAILLSQFLYWLPRSRDHEGWFYKDRDDIQAETGLTRDNQETARRVLREATILEEKYAGMPKRLYFRIDMGELTKRLSTYAQRSYPAQTQPGNSQTGAFHPTRRVHSTQQDGGNPADMSVATHPANTETTTETTPKKQQQGTAVAPEVPVARQEGEPVVVLSDASQGAADAAGGFDVLTGALGLGALQTELVRRGVSEGAAKKWLRDRTPEYIVELLGYHDWCKEHRPDFIHDHGAWLTASLKNPIEFPDRYLRFKETASLRIAQRRRQDEQLRMALLNEARQHATPPEERLAIAQTGWISGFEIAHRRRPTEQELAERRTRLLEGMREEAARFFTEHPELEELAVKSLTTAPAEPVGGAVGPPA